MYSYAIHLHQSLARRSHSGTDLPKPAFRAGAQLALIGAPKQIAVCV